MIQDIFKVHCPTTGISRLFQLSLRENFHFGWGKMIEMQEGDAPWNLERQWLIVRRGTRTGRMVLSWSRQSEFDELDIPEVDPEAFAKKPIEAFLNLLVQGSYKGTHHG